jgi:hypothetical protein
MVTHRIAGQGYTLWLKIILADYKSLPLTVSTENNKSFNITKARKKSTDPKKNAILIAYLTFGKLSTSSSLPCLLNLHVAES